MERMMNCIVVIDHEGKIRKFNKTAEETFGYSCGEILGEMFSDKIIAIAQATEFAEGLKRFVEMGEWDLLDRRVEFKMRRAGGGEFPVEMELTALMHNKQPIFIVYLYDITSWLQSEDKIRDLSKFPDENPNPVLRVDQRGVLLYSNLAGHILLDVWNCKVGQLLPDPWCLYFTKIYLQNINTELDIICNERIISLTCAPISEAGYVNLYGQDTTDKKHKQKELIHARDEAESANRAKSAFLANISHEIRTPMNAVIGMTELTLNTELNDEQRDYLNIVKRSANSLLHLIDDILDFSKIEAGELSLENTEFDLCQTVESCIESLAFLAREKNLELVWHIDENVVSELIGDPARLRQVLLNLLSNAVKFTEQGEVVVNVHCYEQGPERTTLQFEVRDTGIGIKTDKLNYIFKAFAQADASTTRRYGGTGLGLSICVQLVALMGGKVWGESVEGSGSTFYFTADFRVQKNFVEAEKLLENWSNPKYISASTKLRILVAEDNLLNQKLARILLEKRGHIVSLANNGQEGLDQIESKHFDVVFMDVQMPVKDGLEATCLLRQREEGTGWRTYVIGLTAHTMEVDRKRCIEAGMDDFVTKPINQKDLDRALAPLLIKGPPLGREV